MLLLLLLLLLEELLLLHTLVLVRHLLHPNILVHLLLLSKQVAVKLSQTLLNMVMGEQNLKGNEFAISAHL